MSLNKFTDKLVEHPWMNINCNSVTSKTIDAETVNALEVDAGLVITDRVEGKLSLYNSFEYQVTTITYDPVAVNGAQSLYNGVLEFKNVPGFSCNVTMPTASTLNTVIPTTQLDKCSFTLDLYNTSTTNVMTVIFSGAIGVFNYKTNLSNSPISLAIPFSNVTSHMQLKFIRTQPGGFWTVYY